MFTLIPGPANFIVIEDPAYAPSGEGEHLYVEIEKEGLTTDAVAQALAKVCGKRDQDIGYAGRKDRHAVTRQWFSVHFGSEDQLVGLAERATGGRIAVTQVSRHRNKLRLGHLAGNRFVLGLGRSDGAAMTDAEAATLAGRFADVHHRGVVNAFGPQRFGINGATLAVALAWGRGDHAAAVERIVDPTGGWHVGEPVPDRWYGGPEGRVVAALRKGLAPDKALRQVDDRLVKLVASAAQSAVFNTVLAARQAAGLTHRVRAGDIACNHKGAPFVVIAADVPDLERRCAPGVLDAFATGPLPGGQRLQPAPEVLAEERAWSAATGVDWSWFQDRAVFASPGERRPLVVPLRAVPTVRLDGAVVRVELALPSGTYATTVLEQAGVAVPDDRR